MLKNTSGVIDAKTIWTIFKQVRAEYSAFGKRIDVSGRHCQTDDAVLEFMRNSTSGLNTDVFYMWYVLKYVCTDTSFSAHCNEGRQLEEGDGMDTAYAFIASDGSSSSSSVPAVGSSVSAPTVGLPVPVPEDPSIPARVVETPSAKEVLAEASSLPRGKRSRSNSTDSTSKFEGLFKSLSQACESLGPRDAPPDKESKRACMARKCVEYSYRGIQ